MANIFVRINEIMSANINDLIDRMEDPERMIKQIIRELEENLRRAEEGVIDAIASEKELGRELETQMRQVDVWKKKAESALKAGDEELARRALFRKNEHVRLVSDVEVSWKAANRTSEALKREYKDLEKKLEEMRRKKSALAARQKAAEAREQMNVTRRRFRKGVDVRDRFHRMEDRVMEIEVRAEAVAELHDDISGLDREFDDMTAHAEVENELAQMRKKTTDAHR